VELRQREAANPQYTEGAKMKMLRSLLIVSVVLVGGTSAQAALPEFSGEFPDNMTAAATSPKSEAAGGALVTECGKLEGTATFMGAKTGSVDLLFLECTGKVLGISVGKCTGLNDTTTGSLLLKGTFTLGFELETLIPVIGLSFESAHFECGSTLTVVTGCLVGTTTLVKSNTQEWLFKASGGKQELTDYTNDKGEMVSCKLLSSINGGEAKEFSLIMHVVQTVAKAIEVKD
jgi:hypothetical protein